MSAQRRRLPDRRPVHTFKVYFVNGTGMTFEYVASISLFDDGHVAEAFLDSHRAGTDVQAMASDTAVMLSIALQYGMPLEAIRESMSRNQDGTPQSLFGAFVDAIADELKDPVLLSEMVARWGRFK